MKRIAALSYGVVSYLVFFATFLYGTGFIGNIGLAKSLDSPGDSPLVVALVVNLGLLLLFAVQHSVMARPWFKQWWTQVVPKPIERSTYVLFSSAALLLLFLLWQPMGGLVWQIQNEAGRNAVQVLFGLGCAIVLFSTFLLNHFELFGLRQVWLYFRGKPYTHLPFKTPVLYKMVRHPLYVGWLTMFWAAPTMTMAHLLFAVSTTVYILMAIRWEEQDLIDFHGLAYQLYREYVPMLIPGLRIKNDALARLEKQAAIDASRAQVVAGEYGDD